MIRVNLLQTGQAEKKSHKAFLPPEQRSAVLGLGMLVLVAVGIGGYWWLLTADRSNVQAQIGQAEVELVQLKRASDLVDQANARKSELSERLTLIERLRAAKRGPVTLLQTVSSSIPEGLWLLEMKQQGTSVQVDGRALSLTSVTDFAQRMQNSGFFQRPVEILTTTIEVVEETPVVRFSVRAEAVTPTVDVSTAASVTTAAAPSTTRPSVPAGGPSGEPPASPGV